MAQERDLVLEREKTHELTQKLEKQLTELQATADLSKLSPDESAEAVANLRTEVMKLKGAFARGDGSADRGSARAAAEVERVSLPSRAERKAQLRHRRCIARWTAGSAAG